MNSVGSAWGEVVVHRGPAGVVLVEPADLIEDRVSSAVVPAVGGTLVVHVERPEAIPSVVLTEPFWAQTWLAGVYGREVADAVKEFEDADVVGPVTVTARHDHLSEAVRRLGIGFWLHRWWPSGSDVPELDTRLLELELAALAWHAEALFVDTSPIVRLLRPHVELLGSLVEDLRRDGVGDAAERDLGVLTVGLRATSDLIEASTPGFHRCRALLAALDQERAVVGAETISIDWRAVADDLWDSLEAAVPERELALASKGGVDALRPSASGVGYFTVDEQQVPPHTVAAREDNGHWIRGADPADSAADSPAGAPLVTVRVEAAPGYAAERQVVLVASLGSVTIALGYDANSQSFVGSGEVPPGATDDPATGQLTGPTPFVYSPAYVTAARTDAEAAEDRARRRRIIADRRTADHGVGSQFIAERKAFTDGE